MKLSIKAKLVAIFAVFLASAIILGGLGVYSLMNVNHKSEQIARVWLPGVSISNQMNTLMTAYSRKIFEYLGAKTPQEAQQYENEADELNRQVLQAVKDYRERIARTEYASESEHQADVAQLDQIERQWNAYYPVTKQTMAFNKANDKMAAMLNARQVAAPLLADVKASIEQLVAFNEKGSNAFADEITATYEKTRLLLISIIIVAMLLGSAVIFWIGRDILSAIRNLLAVMREISQGDLRVSAEIKTKDEMGDLSAATNQMVDNVKQLIHQIQNTAEQVAASSEELTASSDQTADVTNTVAQSITNVSAMTSDQVNAVNLATNEMENVAAGIEESAATVSLSADQTKDVVETAKRGTEKIDSAVRQMNNIEATVDNLATLVAKLGERSQDIGKIVDAIAALAGQTNLLALNAAIEAARAGEQGRGFAVVAEEVRKLAGQSQDATQEIATLISEIQADTERAVVAMGDGTQAVKTGASVVNEAGTAFAKIYEMVDVVHHQANETSKTMDDLAKGTQNVVASVQEIDRSSKNVATESQSVSAATEEQAASIQEIAASSRCLAQLAQDLATMSSKFKV